MISVRFVQVVFLAAFAVVCYFVGLRGWRFSVVFASTAMAILFFAFFYEHMIQALGQVKGQGVGNGRATESET